jgi:NitT/TauT family transport system permease protein
MSSSSKSTRNAEQVVRSLRRRAADASVGLLRSLASTILLIAALVGVWWAVIAVANVPGYLLPPPIDVARALGENFGFFLENTAVTFTEILLGLGLAVVGAVVWAALIVSVQTVRKAVFPLMVVAQSAPKEALAPVFIIWWGFSPLPKIVMASLIAFFPVLVTTVVGLERYTEQQRLLAASMGAGPIRQFFSFRIWAALPSFLSGIRLGVTLAAIGAVLGEYLGSDRGLGYMILTSARQLNGGFLYGSLIALMVMSWAMVKVVDLVEALLLRGTRAGRGV